MTRPENFASFLGNPHVVEILRRAVQLDRLPHALIFAGPEGVGRRTLALLLAQRLNCEEPSDDDSCGRCASCVKILGGHHPDVLQIEPDGAYIRIDQARDLINEVAYQPFEARMRLAILDDAAQMRAEGANSLLKTLEEPPSRTILVLVTTRPYLLLQTIRSRCRMLRFGGIPPRLIEARLVALGRPREDARLAASHSNGSLGNALSFDVERYRETRGKALDFVRLLLQRGAFAEASRLAVTVAKDKDLFTEWTESTLALLQDVYFAGTVPARMAHTEIVDALRALASEVPRDRVVSAIESVKKLRAGIAQNLNRQIALEAMFLSETQAGSEPLVSRS